MRFSSLSIGSAGIAVLCAAALAACGSSSSKDKPGYCADRSDLQQTVTDLKGVDVTSSGAIQAQVSKVSDSARALATSAKADFPQQSSGLSSAITALDSSAKSLASAPSAKGALTVGRDVASVVTAAQTFADATKDAC
jgi:hypothetical protein